MPIRLCRGGAPATRAFPVEPEQWGHVFGHREDGGPNTQTFCVLTLSLLALHGKNSLRMASTPFIHRRQLKFCHLKAIVFSYL